MDTDTQRELFSRAVAALGGQQATARALDMSDRSVRMLLAGERRLHPGILEDMAKALIAHADLCRQLERQLSPAFATNMTPESAKPPKHNRREIARARLEGRSTPAEAEAIRALGRKLGMED